MVTGIKDNLGGWILMLKAISHLRQLLKFYWMEPVNEFGLVCLGWDFLGFLLLFLFGVFFFFFF